MIDENKYGTFYWEKYVQDNKDLAEAGINSKDNALFHYNNYGINENRIIYHINDKNITFEIFHWKKYIDDNSDIKKDGNINKEQAWIHYINYGINENRKIAPLYKFINYENIYYEDFDWENYLKINKDVTSDVQIVDKMFAWNHWKNFGLEENRPVSYINNTNIHNGRFGNLFFINMVVHFIAKKFNLKVNYKYFDKYKKMGIDFYLGFNTYDKNILITENNFIHIMQNLKDPCNIIITNDVWFQNKDLCILLKNYFNSRKIKKNVIEHNIYKDRYKKNNDVFVHIRLGDIQKETITISNYYIKLLGTIKYNKGYISSDSIDSELCKLLITKFNLNIIDYDEVETIMFASTCNNLILSGGTFSWLIGFLAFYSKNIYYPKINNPWFGNIFDFNGWKCIS